MPKTFTEQTFRSTYKDDHRDSDGYHRILFNAGRALQARELTQMQTIIQEEISRFANNIFQKDGVPVLAGGVSVNNRYNFIKISDDQNNTFNNVDNLKGVVLTGATSGIKVKVYQAVADQGTGNPDTLYVQYLDDATTISPATALTSSRKVTPGEILSNGSDINLTVQTTNTATNPAIGYGSNVTVGDSHFYAQGHFVFVEKQSAFLHKYKNNITADIGFIITQDIVTVSDTDELYDNQGAVPNRASPGADRYRIKLVLKRRDQVKQGETFVYFCRIEGGLIVDQLTSTEGYNQVKNFVAERIKEIHGDFIKKYWKLRVEPNGTNPNSSTLILRIDPGLAYVDGKRVATNQTRTIPIPKATDTVTKDDEQIGIDYGNYYYFDSGVGMLDIDTCERVTLYAGFGGADAEIGSANIRAITEGTSAVRTGGYTYARSPLYKAHLFNIQRTNFDYSLRDVKSIKSNTNSHLVNLVQVINNVGSILHEPKKNVLIFDTPRRRPKGFTDVSMTFMKKVNFTASGTTHQITLTDVGETYVRESDIIVSSATEFAASGITPNIQVGNKSITFSGLSNGVAYEAIVFIKKTNAEVKTKTLTETTTTATLDSDGLGHNWLSLGKSDIYSITRISKNDSDGEDIFPYFMFDAGHRTTHYDDGRLVWTGGGIDSANQPVFVRFKYFEPSVNGQFYAVNSYDGQLPYLDIPAQKLADGGKVSLRDVIDFRPSTDGSGSFTNVPPLMIPTDTFETSAEYYLPRADRLVISTGGELRYIKGSSSENPKFPDVPNDCIDLYKVRLNPNTLHTQDLTTTLIPRKGYTMADINKLEEKIDRLEELTTLSLLELNTKFLKVLDSDGNERTKAGFFVDNFKNHKHSQTKAKDYRAAIDKRGLLLRPSYVEDCIDLYYDSDHIGQSGVILKDDLLMLNYSEVAYNSQELASGTENLAPFFVPITIGQLTISPETDSWKETQKVGETVVGTATEFDLKAALNWNNSENEWFGVDPTDLEVGDASTSFVSGTSTTVTHNSLDPALIGTETTEVMGEWVKVGTVTDVETLYTETVEISREREEEITRSTVDWQDWLENQEWATQYDVDIWETYPNGYSGGWDGYGFYWNWWSYDVITTDMWDVVTSETREKIKTTNTSTYEATKTINTENTYEGTAEVVTTTTTSNTVNRIASESTIRDVVGRKVIDVSVIPFMRSIKINFKAEGLRPNTQYFPFFDNTNVSPFCREESSFRTLTKEHYLNAASNADGEGTQRTTQTHSAGTTNLVSDAEGTVIGSFEVPNNVAMRFHTGQRDFALLDVNTANFNAALSFAKATFYSQGALEEVEDEVKLTRVLKVVGSNTNSVDRSVNVESTIWTETVVDTEIAEDVRSTETLSTLVTDTTKTREFIDTDVTFDNYWWDAINPVDHTTDTDTPAGGTSVPYTDDNEETPDAGQVPAGGGQTGRLPGSRRKRNQTEDISFYNDPLAQTFLVEQNSGIFASSIDVYFSSKADVAPVFCEIRPTVNGIPSSSKMLTSKKLSPSQVTVVPNGSNMKQMLQYPTKFEFDAPVFLSKGEYAIVLRPGNNDPSYNVYVATVGDNQLGSNESFISQQPTLGGFFKSQNGKLWEPSSGQDLAYRINRANFVTDGKTILENVNVPPVALAPDPLKVDSGSNIVRVMLKGHGLRDGDKTWIRGIDSATSFGNGLTGADVNGVRTVIDYDNSGYTYQASSSATSRKWFGGQSVTSQRNVNFEILRPEINITQPATTNVTMSVKSTTQQSLAGSETRFQKDTAFIPVENEKNNTYNTARSIYNRRTENLTGAGKLEGERSLSMQIKLSSTDGLVSPVIDMQRAKVNLVHNLISRQDSAATDGFNVPLTYVSERHPNEGTESAKHITKVTTLTEEAVGLKILLAANKPPQSEFLVYWRVASGGDTIQTRGWTLVTPDSTSPTLTYDTNPNIFREYRYLVGGDGGTMQPFTQFQVKIVMRSTSSAKVPSFRDLRIISLAT